MRMSSSLVAPSAVAILSTALLCALSGTAVSQTTPGSSTHFPTSRSSAEARGEAATAGGTPKGPVQALRAGRTSRATQTATGTPSAARGPVMAKLARLEREASSCNDGCESSFKRGKDPWVGCSESAGYYSVFSATCKDTLTHKDYVQCIGNQNVPGLGPTTILVVLHRHADWGEISGHRRESKQVAHAYRGSIADS